MAAVVLNTGAVSRGSLSQQTNKERDIRKEFVEKDRVEGVILLPENLFYNTTYSGSGVRATKEGIKEITLNFLQNEDEFSILVK